LLITLRRSDKVADFWRSSPWLFAYGQPRQANPLFCAQYGRTHYRIKNINIDIDFIDSLCYKMNSNGLVAKTLGFGRSAAHDHLLPGQRHRRRYPTRYLTKYLTRKARQQLQRVQSLEPLRRWLPAVVGTLGVAYGVISLRGMYRPSARGMSLATPGRLRVFPIVALNAGSLALILIGSRLHGHWFIRIVRHSPAQSVMIAGELSCQPLWVGVQQEQENDALSEAVTSTAY
jgi:hypothetical protein